MRGKPCRTLAAVFLEPASGTVGWRESGRMMFRVDPEVHRRAALAAELAGKSLNRWAEEVLERAAR